MMTYLIISLVLLYILCGVGLKAIFDELHPASDNASMFVFILMWPVALLVWAAGYIIDCWYKL